ncbi:MAG: MlaC/ttg2D family ABC transporter substrate-binding protein [Gammaproteobacteria bacterium]
MELRKLAAGLLMLALLPAGAARADMAEEPESASQEQTAEQSAAGPKELIEQTANRVLESMEGRRDELRAKPQELYEIVDEILLPHFDIEYAARLILARHWRRASEEQRERFQNAMYQSLVRTYADGLLDFTTEKMTVQDARKERDGDRATVPTQVVLDDGTRAPVDYILHMDDGQWKVFDVKIEGRSYVLNYRRQLENDIERRGIETVIADLEKDPEALEALEPEQGQGQR